MGMSMGGNNGGTTFCTVYGGISWFVSGATPTAANVFSPPALFTGRLMRFPGKVTTDGKKSASSFSRSKKVMQNLWKVLCIPEGQQSMFPTAEELIFVCAIKVQATKIAYLVCYTPYKVLNSIICVLILS
jgi:hypothetical protein